ncbi:L-Ala-D/L-amino acid epimerase-like isoform X2 [Euphorbia lathyris]|uniref:L-Ala-D/L-amino acid epimerase-like isoform X2 n=1 Tax=Euphorbia lathyris TaxID=212925 RepID=UPI0033135E58
MALINSFPLTSIFDSCCNVERVFQNGRGKMVVCSLTTVISNESESKRRGFGFKNLAETFWVDVQRAEGRALNVEVNAGVGIEKLENVAIRVELMNGCVGWGEVSVVPSLTTSTNQTVALAKVKEASQFLTCSSPKILDLLLHEIAGILPGTQFASVRAGVEMALIDAVANSIDVPLWRLFGGVSNTLSTAITLPTNYPAELASKYCELGFKTFKLKMGNNIGPQIKTLQAIQTASPHISFILDASEGYTPQQAIQLLQNLHVHRDDWEGLGEVSNLARVKYGISVGVDESCQSLSDIGRVINENSAHVINVKLAKFGVIGALQVVELARKSGMHLMISSTAETRLATGFAAHLAAGLGCFKFVGLDMPFLLSEDPVICGCETSGPAYKFLNARGQGGFLKWELPSSA